MLLPASSWKPLPPARASIRNPAFPSDNYEVTFDAAGFKQLVRSGMTLQVADVARIDGKLEIGSLADSVEVTAESARLQTDSPEVSAALDSKVLARPAPQLQRRPPRR